MSSANVDLVHSIYTAWGRGDFSETAWADQEIAFELVDGPAPSSLRGLAATRRGWREFLADWEDFRAQAEEYRELDDERVLVFHQFLGRGKRSGLEVGPTGSKGACPFHVVEGKVAELVLYSVRDRAVADLGLAPERGPDGPH